MKSTKMRLVIGLLIGIVFFLIWIKIIDFTELFGYISQINAFLLIPAITFYLLSYFFRSLRLRKLLYQNSIFIHKQFNGVEENFLSPTSYPLSPKIPIFKNYSYVLAGNFINYLIPIRAGEIAKSVFYKKNHDIPYSDSLPSIFIDKLLDTFGIFIVLLLLPFTSVIFTPTLSILLYLLIFVFLLGIAILAISSFSKGFVVRIIKKIFFFLPKKYETKLNDFLELFVQGLAIFIHHKELLIPCLLLTFIATFSDSLFFFMMFKAFDVSINFTQIIFGYTLIFLSYIIPHPPAQIGSNELLMILIFSIGFGYEENLISAIMSLSHFLTAIVIFITGSLSLIYAGHRFFDIIKMK